MRGGLIISLDLPGAEGGILGRDLDSKKVQTRGCEVVNGPCNGHPGMVHREEVNCHLTNRVGPREKGNLLSEVTQVASHAQPG